MQERFNRREAKPLLLAMYPSDALVPRAKELGVATMLSLCGASDVAVGFVQKAFFGPKFRGSGCSCTLHALAAVIRSFCGSWPFSSDLSAVIGVCDLSKTVVVAANVMGSVHDSGNSRKTHPTLRLPCSRQEPLWPGQRISALSIDM